MTRFLAFPAAFLGFALCAHSQLDGARFASELRAKYGPPLARETFTVQPGMEMVVDYAASGHVCRSQLPPMEPDRRSTRAVDDFLAELLPPATRGRELRRWSVVTGAPSASMAEYESVTITETFQDRTRTGVNVTFTKEECRDQPPPG